MTAFEILADLWSEGIRARLTDDGENLSVTAGRLRPRQRTLLIEHKPVLIEYLSECRATSEAVIEAAMRRSDQFGDGPAARAEMVKQCREVPAHLQRDLLRALGGHAESTRNSEAPRW